MQPDNDDTTDDEPEFRTARELAVDVLEDVHADFLGTVAAASEGDVESFREHASAVEEAFEDAEIALLEGGDDE